MYEKGIDDNVHGGCRIDRTSTISSLLLCRGGTSRLYGKHSCCDTRIACKAGIGAKYALNKTWVLQSALEFVSIGGKDDMDYVKNAKMNELYLQIPVRIAARLPLGKDYHASLNAGPYIACGVGGKTSGSIPYYHDTGSSDGNRLFKIDTFGNILENNAGNRRLDGGIIVGSHSNTAGSLSVQRHKWDW